jgi:hypothetical protein
MQTGGHGNDAVMVLVPVAVSIVVGIILFGGPENALEAVNTLVREIVYRASELIGALI